MEHSVTAFLFNKDSVIWTFLCSLYTKADSECLCTIWFHIWGTNLQLFICEIFPQFFGNTFEIFERDFASFIVIKEFESFENLLFGIFFGLKEVSISLRKKSSGYVVGNTQSYKRQALDRLRNSFKSKFKEAQPAGSIRTKAEGRQPCLLNFRATGNFLSFIASEMSLGFHYQDLPLLNIWFYSTCFKIFKTSNFICKYLKTQENRMHCYRVIRVTCQ